MTLKLWTVIIETQGLVLAENEEDAKDFAGEILQDHEGEVVDVLQWDGCLPIGWSGNEEVYHNGDIDITVDEAIEIHNDGQDFCSVDDDKTMDMFGNKP